MTVRRMTSVPWTKASARKSVAQPSWMGMTPARDVVLPAPAPLPSAPPPSPVVSLKPPVVSPEIRDDDAPVASQRPIFISIIPAASEAPSSGRPFVGTARETELEAENAALRAEVGRLASQLASVKARVLAESETEIVRLAIAVGERIAGRELEMEPELILQWVKDGAAALPKKSRVDVAVAPDVAKMLSAEDLESFGNVVIDESLKAGTCELREGPRTIHVGVAARAEAIADALVGDRK